MISKDEFREAMRSLTKHFNVRPEPELLKSYWSALKGFSANAVNFAVKRVLETYFELPTIEEMQELCTPKLNWCKNTQNLLDKYEPESNRKMRGAKDGRSN